MNFTSRKRKQPSGLEEQDVKKNVYRARASQRAREKRMEKRLKTLQDKIDNSAQTKRQQAINMEKQTQQIIDDIQCAHHATTRKQHKKRLKTILALRNELRKSEETEQAYQRSCLEVMKIRTDMVRSSNISKKNTITEIREISSKMHYGFIKSLLVRDRNFILSALLSAPLNTIFFIDVFKLGETKRTERYVATVVPEKSTSYTDLLKAHAEYETQMARRSKIYTDLVMFSRLHRLTSAGCLCGKNPHGVCRFPDDLARQIYSELPRRPQPTLTVRTLSTIVKHPEEYEQFGPDLKRTVEQGFEVALTCTDPCLDTLRSLRARHMLTHQRGPTSVVRKVNKEHWVKRPWREWGLSYGSWTYRLNIDVYLSTTPLRIEAKALHEDLYGLIHQYL